MRIVLLVVCLVFLACRPTTRSDGPAEQPQEMRFFVQPAEVGSGETVTLVLENRSAAAVGYNLCASSLERLAGEEWQSVPSDRMCTMELRTLPDGEDATYPMGLPPDLAPGEYRFRTTVERLEAGDRARLESAPFLVR
jgi:hypothetical protein